MHLTEDELPLVFAEISRITAPGGVFSYSVNTTRPGLDEECRDARGRRFTPLPKEAWEQLHIRAGFVTRHTEETGDITGREGVRWVTFVGVKEGGVTNEIREQIGRFYEVDPLTSPSVTPFGRRVFVSQHKQFRNGPDLSYRCVYPLK